MVSVRTSHDFFDSLNYFDSFFDATRYSCRMCVCVCVECLPCFRVCIGLCSRLKAPWDCKSSWNVGKQDSTWSTANLITRCKLLRQQATCPPSHKITRIPTLFGWMDERELSSAREVHDGISPRLFLQVTDFFVSPPKGVLLRSEKWFVGATNDKSLQIRDMK